MSQVRRDQFARHSFLRPQCIYPSRPKQDFAALGFAFLETTDPIGRLIGSAANSSSNSADAVGTGPSVRLNSTYPNGPTLLHWALNVMALRGSPPYSPLSIA